VGLIYQGHLDCTGGRLGSHFTGKGAWAWISGKPTSQAPSRNHAAGSGQFSLAAMVGNTGYLGYPITLAFAGTQYFGWALFYDLLQH